MLFRSPLSDFGQHDRMSLVEPQDELVEVTPDAVRVRKAILQCNLRPKREVPKKS